MKSVSLNQAQISMLIDGSGVFTEFNQAGVALKDAQLIDTSPAQLGRFEWKINEQGKVALAQSLKSE